MDFVREGIRPRGYGRSDRRFHPHRIAVAVLVLFLSGTAAAAPAPVHCGDEYAATPLSTVKARAHQIWCDAKDIFPAPVTRWRGHEWLRFGEGVALVVAMYPLDQEISNAFAKNHSRIADRYLHAVTHLGGGYGQDLVILTIAGGYFG